MDSFDSEERRFPRSEFMPLSILRAVWKRRLLIFSSWLVLSAVAAVVVYNLPAVYQARAIILIEQQRIPERFVVSTVNESLENRLDRIAQMILSFENVWRIIEEYGLYQDLRDNLVQDELYERMLKNVDVSLVQGLTRKDAPAFQVAFSDSDPATVAQVANRIAQMFVDENIRSRSNQALGTSEFINSQIRLAEQELKVNEDRLREYRQQFTGELPEQENALLTRIKTLQSEFDAAEAAAARAHQEKLFVANALDTARAGRDMIERVAAQEKSTPNGARTSGRRAVPDEVAKLEAAKSQLIELKARYSSTHPDVTRTEYRVKELEAAVAALQSSPSADGEDPLEPQGEVSVRTEGAVLEAKARISELTLRLQAAERTIAAANARRDEIRAELAGAEGRIRRIPVHQQNLAGAVRDYNVALAQYQELLAKRFDADLATVMEQREKAERFTPLEQARQPEKPIKPQRELIFAGACGTALLLSSVFGFLLELRKNVLLGEWEIPPTVPVLGRVPYIDPGPDAPDGMPLDDAEPAAGATPKRALIASSLVLSLVATVVATGVYFGWISF